LAQLNVPDVWENTNTVMEVFNMKRTMKLLALFFGVLMLANDANAESQREPLKRIASKPGESFRDCIDCPEMMVLPAGSTGPAFAMGKYEVTQGQWRAIMGNNPSKFSNCGDNCPVERVSWNDAKDFISRLNNKTGKQYRLPSEAEWEYACRAGGKNEYCGSDSADSVAWHSGNSGKSTHPAGRKQPNAFGLYDMSGNVWELVEDCLDGNCKYRVTRGGSAFLTPIDRGASEPTDRNSTCGFRLARTLP
jgi:formylglycine-generating enzyme required for sulfatase activity